MRVPVYLVLLAVALPVRATTLFVDKSNPSSSDINGHPFRTIQAAIDHAAPSDTVSVAAGTYYEHLGVDRSLSLAGAGSNLTLIDGSDTGTVLSILNTSIVVRVSNLCIQHGRAENGGGVLNAATLWVTGCLFRANVAHGADTGEIDADGTSAAGAALLNVGTAIIDHAQFTSNIVQGGAGGVGGNAGRGSGGAVFSTTSLTIRHSSFTGNAVLNPQSGGFDPAAFGGAVFSIGSCWLTECSFLDNRAVAGATVTGYGNWSGPGLGGAVFSHGQIVIQDSVFSGNFVQGGASDGETRQGRGGAVCIEGTGQVYRSRFERNVAQGGHGYSRSLGQGGGGGPAEGGGIYSMGSLLLQESVVSFNSCSGGVTEVHGGGKAIGGGLCAAGADGVVTSVVRILRSAIYGNDCFGISDFDPGDAMGGGIYVAGTSTNRVGLTVLNSTISGNRLTGGDSGVFDVGQVRGGGAYIDAQTVAVDIEHNTIVSNVITGFDALLVTNHVVGGGVCLDHVDGLAAAAFTRSTIVAHNTARDDGPDVFGLISSGGANLILQTSGMTLAVSSASDLFGQDPLLAPIANNGGPTPTHALLPGSPAIDAAACDPAVTADQRSFARPYGAACDIGAFEAQRVDLVRSYVPDDFDGDHVADLAVIRRAAGNWYVRNSHDGSGRAFNLGFATSIPVPADYDGDLLCDPAVYDPATGRWWLRLSHGGAGSLVWGGPGMEPVPGDYDGDGKADVAVYRKANGQWYIRRSSDGTMLSRTLGGSPMIPVPGDYDGDGKTDPAVYHPSLANWLMLLSVSSTTITQHFGTADGQPVPADYDRDGRTDLAVYRKATGHWYIRQSGSGETNDIVWGASVLAAVPGDYDGDRRADPAVYRRDNGNWYVLPSSTQTGFTQNWGAPVLEPVSFTYQVIRRIGGW